MADLPLVECKAGTIIGTEEKVTIKGIERKIKKFLGIPYASQRRFQKAERLAKFEQPFKAFQFGKACPQVPVPGVFEFQFSEDCLYVNIYVPSNAPDIDKGYAVLVFIHGGGFSYGSGQVFPGENLGAYGNVIVVNFNYRLGFFGFLSSGDAYLPGNLGLYDQHLAFQWIHDNISSFGGDLNRVTIAGESAGGTSVLFQGLYPKNKGLFQRMIASSASPTTKTYLNENPKQQFLFVAKHFGCDSQDIEEILSFLQSKSTNFIIDKLTELSQDPTNQTMMRFSPTVDGDFMKIFPFKIGGTYRDDIKEQIEFFQSLDLLSGFDKYEGALFLNGVEDFTPTREMFAIQLAPRVLTQQLGFILEFVTARIIAQYTSPTKPDKAENIRDQYVELWGDLFFKVGTVEFLRIHAEKMSSANSYLFELRLLPTNHLLPTPSWIKGAGHGDELLYITFFDKNMLSSLGRRSTSHADWEEDFALQFMTYWTNFVKSGNPNEPQKVSYQWPKFDSETQCCLILDRQFSTEEHFYANQLEFWLKVIPDMRKKRHNPQQI